VISASFVTSRHTLLTVVLQMARQIEFDGKLIRFAYRIDWNQLFRALVYNNYLVFSFVFVMIVYLFVHFCH